VTEPGGSPPEPPDERGQPEEERPGLLWRVLKSAIAPDVLEDGGHDAPLTPRGRIIFWTTIAVLILAVSILFVVTLAQR
jgi:hypothetical protein